MPVSNHGRLIEHSERSRSSAKKDMKLVVSAGPQGPERAINSVMSGICEQRRAFVCSSIKHESLILAQNERWRQA
jgi:hypothetical protein